MMENVKETIINSVEELKFLAQQILHEIKQRGVTRITLRGDNGSGKTTFSSYLLTEMGILDFRGSPSFALVEKYTSANNEIIYHLDLDKVEEGQEESLWEDIGDGNLYIIEWADKMNAKIEKPWIDLKFYYIENQGSRKVKITLYV